MASPIVAIGKERNKEYSRIKDENCNTCLQKYVLCNILKGRSYYERGDGVFRYY